MTIDYIQRRAEDFFYLGVNFFRALASASSLSTSSLGTAVASWLSSGWWRGRSSPNHLGGVWRGRPSPQAFGYNSTTLFITIMKTLSLQNTSCGESMLDVDTRRVQTKLRKISGHAVLLHTLPKLSSQISWQITIWCDPASSWRYFVSTYFQIIFYYSEEYLIIRRPQSRLSGDLSKFIQGE